MDFIWLAKCLGGCGGAVVGMEGAQQWHSRDAAVGSVTGTEVGIAGKGWARGGAQGEEVVVMARALGGHSGEVEPPHSPWDGGAVGFECEWVCGAGRLTAGSGRACVTLEGASVTGKGWAG